MLNYTKILIGYNYWDKVKYDAKNPVYYYSYNYGSDAFIAKAGYGKSSLLKHIIVKLYYTTNRQIIIFDKDYEWVNCITKANWRADEPQSIKKYHVITNYSIKISDVAPVDWFYLVPGLGVEVANWIARVAYQGKVYHEDIPEQFYYMIKNLPTKKEELDNWNLAFGRCLKLDELVNSQVKVSIVSKIRDLKEKFYGSKTCERNKTKYILDWEDEIRKTQCCIIDMNIEGYRPDSFEGYMVGYILEILTYRNAKALVDMQPVIVVEEADYLCGNPNTGPIYKSTMMLLSYVAKYRKKDVKVFFVSQSYGQLHPDLRKFFTAEVFGQLEPSDDRTRYEIWQNLEIGGNLLVGKRPFAYIDNIRMTFTHPTLFYPIEPCCNIETQGIIFKEKN